MIACGLNAEKSGVYVTIWQEDDHQFRLIAAILRHLLMLKTETEEKTEEAHR